MDPPNPFLEPPSPQAVKTIMFPYIFKDYTSNYYNYGTNAPNTLLTLAHSIIHYSNNDIVERFFGSMLIFRDEIKTDVQVLYLCALMGPVLYRLEKNVIIMKEVSFDVSQFMIYYLIDGRSHLSFIQDSSNISCKLFIIFT